MKRHIKQKNSLDGTVNLDSSTEMSTEDLYIPQTGVVKSRSLESLKDALKDQEHESKVLGEFSPILIVPIRPFILQ